MSYKFLHYAVQRTRKHETFSEGPDLDSYAIVEVCTLDDKVMVFEHLADLTWMAGGTDDERKDFANALRKMANDIEANDFVDVGFREIDSHATPSVLKQVKQT